MIAKKSIKLITSIPKVQSHGTETGNIVTYFPFMSDEKVEMNIGAKVNKPAYFK